MLDTCEDFDPNLGKPFPSEDRKRRHEFNGQAGWGGDPHDPSDFFLRARRQPAELSRPPGHLLSGRKQPGAIVGQRCSLLATPEQLRPEAFFQVRDSPRDCWLPNFEGARCGAEASPFSDRQERLSVFP
jgi:hypothetical protein